MNITKAHGARGIGGFKNQVRFADTADDFFDGVATKMAAALALCTSREHNYEAGYACPSCILETL